MKDASREILPKNTAHLTREYTGPSPGAYKEPLTMYLMEAYCRNNSSKLLGLFTIISILDFYLSLQIILKEQIHETPMKMIN